MLSPGRGPCPQEHPDPGGWARQAPGPAQEASVQPSDCLLRKAADPWGARNPKDFSAADAHPIANTHPALHTDTHHTLSLRKISPWTEAKTLISSSEIFRGHTGFSAAGLEDILRREKMEEWRKEGGKEGKREERRKEGGKERKKGGRKRGRMEEGKKRRRADGRQTGRDGGEAGLEQFGTVLTLGRCGGEERGRGQAGAGGGAGEGCPQLSETSRLSARQQSDS